MELSLSYTNGFLYRMCSFGAECMRPVRMVEDHGVNAVSLQQQSSLVGRKGYESATFGERYPVVMNLPVPMRSMSAMSVSTSSTRTDGENMKGDMRVTGQTPLVKDSLYEEGASGGLDLLVGVAAMAEAQAVKGEKPKKKRGRKPTPGMTEEERRQHRLMKNRRTAEISRQRRLDYTRTLRNENDDLREENCILRERINMLCMRLGENPFVGSPIGHSVKKEEFLQGSQPFSPVSSTTT